MGKGRKPDRDVISWTKDRHPPTASMDEIGVLTGRSRSFVNAKIKSGAYKTVRVGSRALDIVVDSVFDDMDRMAEASAEAPKPKGGPGRPRKVA
jgi:hypothetical protein